MVARVRREMREQVEPEAEWQEEVARQLQARASGEEGKGGLVSLCRGVIAYCGRQGGQVQESLYTCLALLSSPGVHHRTYNLAGRSITLRESSNPLDLSTSGLSTWPCSTALALWIDQQPEERCWCRWRGCRVLELGSGSGLTGIFLALRWGEVLGELLLTDIGAHTMENLEYNVTRNLTPALQVEAASPLTLALGEGGNLRVEELDWSKVVGGHLPLEPDLVLGADLVYDADSLPSLVSILSLAASPTCTCYLATACRPDTYHLFLHLLSACGLVVETWPLAGGEQAAQLHINPLNMVRIARN